MEQARLNAHSYCAGFEIYAILCNAVDMTSTLPSINKRLEILSISSRFDENYFFATQQDKGTMVQKHLSAIMNELKTVHPISVAAHFILPINGFLTLARVPRQICMSIGQSLDHMILPPIYKEALEGLQGLTDEASATSAEIENAGKAWINGLYNHFCSQAVSSKPNDFDFIEIKPGAFGIKVDVKLFLKQIAQRFRRGSKDG